MKKSKLLFSLSLTVGLLLSSVVNASAESLQEKTISEESNVYPLKLDALTIDTPFDPNLYEYVREENGTGVEVKIVEKSSGRIVSNYGEMVKSSEKPFVMSSGTYTTRLTWNTYYDAGYNETHFAGANLYTSYECWQNGSFGQINASEAYWSPISGNGNFYLESPHAKSTPTGSTGTYPTNKITTVGTVVFTTQESSSAGVNIGKFGFTFGGGSYYRYALPQPAAYSVTFG